MLEKSLDQMTLDMGDNIQKNIIESITKDFQESIDLINIKKQEFAESIESYKHDINTTCEENRKFIKNYKFFTWTIVFSSIFTPIIILLFLYKLKY